MFKSGVHNSIQEGLSQVSIVQYYKSEVHVITFQYSKVKLYSSSQYCKSQGQWTYILLNTTYWVGKSARHFFPNAMMAEGILSPSPIAGQWWGSLHEERTSGSFADELGLFFIPWYYL